MTYSLTGNTVSSTYGRLVQVINSNEYYDGFGNQLNIGQGSQGLSGPQGPQGVVVQMALPSANWEYRSGGVINQTKIFVSDNPLLSNVTYFEIQYLDIYGTDYFNWFSELKYFVDSGQPSYLYLSQNDQNSTSGLYSVSSVTNTGNSFGLNVTPISFGGSFINASTYSISWSTNAVRGNTGFQGPTGPQGETGPQGSSGFQGSTGPQGHSGVQGETGPQGVVVSMVQTVVQWKYGDLNPLGDQPGYFSSEVISFANNGEFNFHINDNNGVDYSVWFNQLKTFIQNNNPSFLQIYDSITVSNTGLYEVLNVSNSGLTYSIIVSTQSIVGNGTFSTNQIYNVTWIANGSIGPQGFSGVQGYQGVSGPQGYTGNQGSTGPQGMTGVQGETGPQGFQGLAGPTGPGIFTISATAPSSPQVGDRWYHLSTGLEYVYIDDGDSIQWVTPYILGPPTNSGGSGISPGDPILFIGGATAISFSSPTISFWGDVIPSDDRVYDLGSTFSRWRELYVDTIHVATQSIYIGDLKLSNSNGLLLVQDLSRDGITSSVINGSTGLQGSIGPQGPAGSGGGATGTQGSTGPQGNLGPQGPAGTGGGGASYLYDNTAFVHPDGDNSTAVLGDFSLPFATIEGALNKIKELPYPNSVIEIWPKNSTKGAAPTFLPSSSYDYTVGDTLVINLDVKIHLKPGVRIRLDSRNGSDTPFFRVMSSSYLTVTSEDSSSTLETRRTEDREYFILVENNCQADFENVTIYSESRLADAVYIKETISFAAVLLPGSKMVLRDCLLYNTSIPAIGGPCGNVLMFEDAIFEAWNSKLLNKNSSNTRTVHIYQNITDGGSGIQSVVRLHDSACVNRNTAGGIIGHVIYSVEEYICWLIMGNCTFWYYDDETIKSGGDRGNRPLFCVNNSTNAKVQYLSRSIHNYQSTTYAENNWEEKSGEANSNSSLSVLGFGLFEFYPDLWEPFDTA